MMKLPDSYGLMLAQEALKDKGLDDMAELFAQLVRMLPREPAEGITARPEESASVGDLLLSLRYQLGAFAFRAFSPQHELAVGVAATHFLRLGRDAPGLIASVGSRGDRDRRAWRFSEIHEGNRAGEQFQTVCRECPSSPMEATLQAHPIDSRYWVVSMHRMRIPFISDQVGAPDLFVGRCNGCGTWYLG